MSPCGLVVDLFRPDFVPKGDPIWVPNHAKVQRFLFGHLSIEQYSALYTVVELPFLTFSTFLIIYWQGIGKKMNPRAGQAATLDPNLHSRTSVKKTGARGVTTFNQAVLSPPQPSRVQPGPAHPTMGR